MYKDLFEVLEILNIEENQLIQYGLDKLIHSDSREILQDTGRITEILLLNNLLEFMDKEFESLERKLSMNLEKKMERLYISLEERNEQSLKVIEFDMKKKTVNDNIDLNTKNQEWMGEIVSLSRELVEEMIHNK